MKAAKIGIAWYKDADSFNAMKDFVTDKEIWEDKFEIWQKDAIIKEKEINKNAKFKIVRVNITSEGLKEYCIKNNMSPDAKTRAQYVMFLLKQSYGN